MIFIQFLRAYTRFILGAAFFVAALGISFVGLYGLNLGLEFTGGVEIEFSLDRPVDSNILNDKRPFTKGSIVPFGSSTQYLMKVPQLEDTDEDSIRSSLNTMFTDIGSNGIIERIDIVGSEFSEGMVGQGVSALLVAFFAMTVYISLRFEWRLAVSAIIALLFDPIIILFLFSLFQWTFDAAALAGLLAVIGYSINDTIVVFDRVRENFQRLDKPSEDIFYDSIEQTMSRTLITSLLTFMVVFALLIFGTEVLRGFSLALIIGIVIGTCSSIMIAGPLALMLGIKKEHLFPLDDELYPTDENTTSPPNFLD